MLAFDRIEASNAKKVQIYVANSTDQSACEKVDMPEQEESFPHCQKEWIVARSRF